MLVGCGRAGREAPGAGQQTSDPPHATTTPEFTPLDPTAKADLGPVGAVAKRETVCLDAADADFVEISMLYASAGWSIQRPGTNPCRYLVHYNEAYNEFPSLKSDGHHVFNTEKCVFDVFTEANGSIGIVRAAALRSRPGALKNCAARALLALEGRPRALIAKDSDLTDQAGGSPEEALSTAVADLNANSKPGMENR